MTKAPLGGEGTGANPTDRGKRGTKRSLLTEGNGIPLSVAVDGANRHNKKLDNYLALLHFACAWITFRASGLFG